MRSSLLTIVCTAVWVWNALAQDHTDQAKYELIRETINFLATDNVVSRDTNFTITCETLDYDCFKQQLSGNPVAGIEQWYNRWRSITVTDEASLTVLRDRVFADIFERPGKGYRKQLVGYEGYIARIERLIDQDADEVPLAEIAVDTTPQPLSPTELPPIHPEQLTDRNDNPEKDHTMIAYLALALGIIALILAALPVFKKREQQLSADLLRLQKQLDELTDRMERLEQKITDNRIKDDAIASLTEIMESVEKRVVELENSSRPRTN